MMRRRSALGAALGLVLAASVPAYAEWTSASGSGTAYTRAASPFPSACTPGSANIAASADVTFLVGATTQTDNGNLLEVGRRQNTTRRLFARFALPVLPAGCAISLGTFSLKVSGFTLGRVLVAERTTSGWIEDLVFDAPFPTTTPTGATAIGCCDGGTVTWGVTTIVQDWYNGANNFGIGVRDSNESQFSTNKFFARETGDGPILHVEWA